MGDCRNYNRIEHYAVNIVVFQLLNELLCEIVSEIGSSVGDHVKVM